MKRKWSLICAASLCGAIALCVAPPAMAGARDETGKQPLVVGGNVADPGQWPFMAAIFYDGNQGCGGTVIAPTAILTAAHCVDGFPARDMSVVTGRRALSDVGSGEAIDVLGYYVHPYYGHDGRTDLAVIRLERPTSAPAAQLSEPWFDRAITARGSVLRVAGWGATTPYGEDGGSDVLLETSERVKRNRACRRAYRGSYAKYDQVCTTGSKINFGQNTSSCFGDSGGPIVADTSNGRRVVGVVSFGGRRCGHPRFPSVYARVAPQLDWLAAAATA